MLVNLFAAKKSDRRRRQALLDIHLPVWRCGPYLRVTVDGQLISSWTQDRRPCEIAVVARGRREYVLNTALELLWIGEMLQVIKAQMV